ncbi:MAG: hypothetical protein OEV86_15270, partial [Candidatus Krumholzibacteria bacterium]|nr:hypothetical protein [Candidatus Krumholzibacteria bacterium]
PGPRVVPGRVPAVVAGHASRERPPGEPQVNRERLITWVLAAVFCFGFWAAVLFISWWLL